MIRGYGVGEKPRESSGVRVSSARGGFWVIWSWGGRPARGGKEGWRRESDVDGGGGGGSGEGSGVSVGNGVRFEVEAR